MFPSALHILRSCMPMLTVFFLNEAVFRLTDWYDRFPSIDIPMHLAGGFVTAWTVSLFLAWYQKRQVLIIQPAWLFIIVYVGVAALAAIGWELYEFAHDVFLPGAIYQGTMADTMFDLVNGVVGAGVFGIFWAIISRMKK